jgi:hypothetical protein
MMPRIPEFTVDEDSDPKHAAEAFKELQRMVHYGRMAERALRSIRETGFYDGLAPVAPLPGTRYGINMETKYQTHVNLVHFPKRLPISRADLGDMALLRVEMGQAKDAEFAGNPTREIPLFIVGPLATQITSGKAEYEIEDGKRPCGHIRINKSHLSWLAPAAYAHSHGDAHQVYKDMRYPKAQLSAKAFSKAVSKILVVKDAAANEVLNGSTMLAAAKTLDLQATAWEWFYEDGHAARMFADIHQIVRVIEVMEA